MSLGKTPAQRPSVTSKNQELNVGAIKSEQGCFLVALVENLPTLCGPNATDTPELLRSPWRCYRRRKTHKQHGTVKEDQRRTLSDCVRSSWTPCGGTELRVYCEGPLPGNMRPFVVSSSTL